MFEPTLARLWLHRVLAGVAVVVVAMLLEHLWFWCHIVVGLRRGKGGLVTAVPTIGGIH